MNSSFVLLCQLVVSLLAPGSDFFSFLAIGGADAWEKWNNLHFVSNVDSVEQRLIEMWLFKYTIN